MQVVQVLGTVVQVVHVVNGAKAPPVGETGLDRVFLERVMMERVPAIWGCLLPVRAKAKMKGNKYGATRSAGDYQRKATRLPNKTRPQSKRKVQLARLCAWGGEDMV